MTTRNEAKLLAHGLVQPSTRLFLTDLYREVNDAATNDLDIPIIDEIHRLMRLVRTRRFISTCQPAGQTATLNCISSFYNDNPGSPLAGTLHHDLDRSNDLAAVRMLQVLECTTFHVLSVCAHSLAFRTALTSPDIPHRQVRWSDRLEAISQSAASLELFAKTRGLDFVTPITIHNDYFGDLYRQCLGPRASANSLLSLAYHGIEIQKQDLEEKHALDLSLLDPHKWKLTADGSPAKQCMITYDVTAEVAIDFAELQVGMSVTTPPVLIEDSEIVPSSVFNGAGDWPEYDPRFSGFGGVKNKCYLNSCQKRAVKKIGRRSQGVNVEYERRCTHTFEDLRSEHAEAMTPLIELMEYPRIGVGVRALQLIKKGTIIGNYVGELYPVPSMYRYEGFEGKAYNFRLAIQAPHPKPKAPSKPKSNGYSTGKKRKRADPEPDMDDIDRWYCLDAAVKGSWTRYINHSCDNNTAYHCRNVGQRTLILVAALRDIDFGEQITVHYGDEYFQHMPLACKCGAPECLLWKLAEVAEDDEAPEPNRQTLGEALQDGTAPEWAVQLHDTAANDEEKQPRSRRETRG